MAGKAPVIFVPDRLLTKAYDIEVNAKLVKPALQRRHCVAYTGWLQAFRRDGISIAHVSK
jgi:hypothetical protein